MKRATLGVVGALLIALVPGYGPAGGAEPLATSGGRHATATEPAAGGSRAAAAMAQAVGLLTPAAAVTTSVSHAAANGATAYISVVNRSNGTIAAQSGNAEAQVGSESIMKLILASYYLVLYGGYTATPSSVLSQLSFMLRYSDDATASSLFTSNAIPTMAARYGLGSTINATDRPGHWGAARITAHDMAHFLYRAAGDSEVGPWLIPVMSQTAPSGSDGFDQHFGLNALGGVHGSKQGWGCDSYFTAKQCAIHSVGYTDRYFVAVLQLSNSYPDPMRGNATFAAQQVQASRQSAPIPVKPPPIRNGDFVRDPRTGGIYRIAGGAPIYVSSFAAVAGSKAFRTVTAAQFDALAPVPANGTALGANREVFVVAGGAPVYATSWAAVGGPRLVTNIDVAAIIHAREGGHWNHLNPYPAAGTLLGAGREVYVAAGGAPIFASNWAAIGGARASAAVDPAAVAHAGQGGHWNQMNAVPAAGTLLQAGAEIYAVAGGAPTYVSNYPSIGGARAATRVDPAAIVDAQHGGHWNHLNSVPANGTFIFAGASNYRVAGGAPIYVSSWSPFGGQRGVVRIDAAAVSSAGRGGRWNHLSQLPADGTLLAGLPGGRSYRVSGGVPRPIGTPATKVGVSQEAIDRAGQSGVWSHLRHP